MKTVIPNNRKSGRPGKDIKKEVRAAVRFSRYEYFIVKEKSLQAGMSPSAFIRKTSIEGKVVQRLTEEQVFFIRQLAGMSNNINQVAKVCQREGLYESMKYFSACQQQIDDILKNLKP